MWNTCLVPSTYKISTTKILVTLQKKNYGSVFTTAHTCFLEALKTSDYWRSLIPKSMKAIDLILWNTKLDWVEGDLQHSRRMVDTGLLAMCLILSDHNQSRTVDKIVLKLVITKGRNARHCNSTIPHYVTCRTWQKSQFNRKTNNTVPIHCSLSTFSHQHQSNELVHSALQQCTTGTGLHAFAFAEARTWQTTGILPHALRQQKCSL